MITVLNSHTLKLTQNREKAHSENKNCWIVANFSQL